MSLSKSKLVFSLLYLPGLVLLFSLAYWQYSRGQEKIKIAALRTQIGNVVLARSPNNWEAHYYRDIKIKGEWLGENAFLLENRIKGGQVGYEVLSPFKLSEDQSVILVNRGWVKNEVSANEKAIGGKAIINGTIYLPEKGVVLGDAILPLALSSTQFPKRSLYIDMPVFARVLKQTIQPVLFVLEEKEAMSYPRLWKASVMTADKHMGYAVQWLGLGLTFLVYGVIWFRRRQ